VRVVFFAFRDAPDRRAALRARGSLDRYRLFGLDEVYARGVRVRHNLEREGAHQHWARAADVLTNGALGLSGGYGGDFASVLASLRRANEADVVFSTADTVGIPLILLKRAGRLRPPLVYAAVGLPERLVQLRRGPMQRLYASALRRAHTIVAYAESEAQWLRAWLGPDAPRVAFVPFGVDINAFSPRNESAEVDVVSVGADPHRDFDLLTDVASRQPNVTFRIVAATDRARALAPLPANVAVETDVPLERVRELLGGARVVALPVRRNSYSGATTVLLQAMAMAKPVIVSRTDAIASGYGLQDGVNCRLVEPGDAELFERTLLETLNGANAASLGTRARDLVEREFTWERYTDALWEILSAAAASRENHRPWEHDRS
jgi:glycosyltransferase involved in cell wall biosynthesis